VGTEDRANIIPTSMPRRQRRCGAGRSINARDAFRHSCGAQPDEGWGWQGRGDPPRSSSLSGHQAARRRPQDHHAATLPNLHTKTGSMIGQGAVPASRNLRRSIPWHYGSYCNASVLTLFYTTAGSMRELLVLRGSQYPGSWTSAFEHLVYSCSFNIASITQAAALNCARVCMQWSLPAGYPKGPINPLSFTTLQLQLPILGLRWPATTRIGTCIAGSDG